ncbi:hypothetical protein RV10_GL001997 [Enterococcus pallens]|nr:hypothetical protein RV10_GL001997 [Enterococcus pallens]
MLLACFFSYALLDKFFQSANQARPLLISGRLAVQTEFHLINTIYGPVILAASFLGSDFTQRTLYQHLANGHSRIQLVLAKSLIYSIVGSVLLLLTPFITIATVTLVNGWGTTFNLMELQYVLRVFSLAFLLNAASIRAFVFISFICQDVQKTLMCSTIFAVVYTNMSEVLGTISSQFQLLYTYLSSQQLQIIAQRHVSLPAILLALVISIVTWGAFTAGSIYVFEKQDLT